MVRSPLSASVTWLGPTFRDSDRDLQKGTLPEHLERIRTQVACGPDAPSYCATYNAADTFDRCAEAPTRASAAFLRHRCVRSVGCDNAHDWDAWEEKVKVGIVSLTEREMVFDLVGVDVAFANALRRILIAEVRDAIHPAMGSESVRRESETAGSHDGDRESIHSV